MLTPELRQLPWPAAAAGLDAPARLRHLVAGALRTGRPLAVWREPGAGHPCLLARAIMLQATAQCVTTLQQRCVSNHVSATMRRART